MSEPTQKPARKRKIAQCTILILLGALGLLEAVGSLYYRVWNGNSSAQLIDLFRKDPESEGIGMVTRYKHHPFLLFAPDSLLKVESAGKIAPLDTVRIALTGGSVAHSFALWDERTSGFQTELRREISCLKDRRVELINLAADGYKQPQQLIATSLLLDRADYFLNLDGLNESIGDPLGFKFPASYPLFMLQFSNRPLEGSAIRWVGSAARTTYMGFLRTAKRNPWLAQSGAYVLTWRMARAPLLKLFQSSQTLLAARNGKPAETESSKRQLAHRNIANWESALTRQHQILKANHKPHLFYVEPNLHLAERKLLSVDELSLKQRRPQWAEVGQTLLHLASRVPVLRKQGVPVADLTPLYQAETRTVYSDDIGHLNDTGQAFLAGRFATDLKKIISCD